MPMIDYHVRAGCIIELGKYLHFHHSACACIHSESGKHPCSFGFECKRSGSIAITTTYFESTV